MLWSMNRIHCSLSSLGRSPKILPILDKFTWSFLLSEGGLSKTAQLGGHSLVSRYLLHGRRSRSVPPQFTLHTNGMDIHTSTYVLREDEHIWIRGARASELIHISHISDYAHMLVKLSRPDVVGSSLFWGGLVTLLSMGWNNILNIWQIFNLLPMTHF